MDRAWSEITQVTKTLLESLLHEWNVRAMTAVQTLGEKLNSDVKKKGDDWKAAEKLGNYTVEENVQKLGCEFEREPSWKDVC